MDFTNMSNEALAAARAEKRAEAEPLFALETPTIEQVDTAEALMASIGEIEAEQATRAAAVADAAARFAAARTSFSAEAESAEEVESEVEASAEEAEPAEEVEPEVEASAEVEAEPTEEPAAEVAASVDHTKTQVIKASAAKKVARAVKRPAAKATPQVVITASGDIPNVPMGSQLSDMEAVASAVQARVKGFAPFNARAAEAAHSASGGKEVLNKFAVASFGLDFEPGSVAKKHGDDYGAVKAAVKQHEEALVASMRAAESGKPDALTAAGWCAPSPYVYNWIADYVVDGLLTLPEVSAPRGGLQITTGPQLAQTTYADVDDFGFGGTEAEAIAGYTKTCETIECPEFVDHRLDFSGYCWKIPILTEHAYPELVADALRLSDVLYAHKMNKRFINDIVGLSMAVNANGYGGTFTDTLEALTQIAVKERRWWNIGENAVMEVKLPQAARDIFKFDMARRSGLSLDDIATDQKIAAHFANHNLSVEYVSDWQERSGAGAATADWAAGIEAIIYPSGTFAKAVEPVINLSAVYDAASLSANEYTGVFFEQGVMTLQLGYRSHVVTVPVCTAGVTGANALFCEDGSL